MCAQMPDDWTTAYEQWTTKPGRDTLAGVVTSLQPTINQKLAAMGAHSDPILQSHAPLLAAEAIKTWKPEKGASLPTWVSTQLNQLYRVRRNSGPVHIPERQQLDAMRVFKLERELEDATGEVPTADVLADKAGMSVKRLKEIRTRMRPVVGEANLGSAELPGSTADFTQEAMDLLYSEADKVDKLIIEGRTGYGGASVVDTPVLLKRTKLDQFQLARRAVKLHRRMQNLRDELERVYGGGA